MSKRQRLLKLRERIIDNIYKQRWEEVWFFPRYHEVPEVKGFLGTAPIVFASINPSFGTYPSKADIFYYETLRRQGFEDAHLTDVFKVKRKKLNARDLLNDKSSIREAEKFLDEEMNIVKPKALVFVGRSKLYREFYERFFKRYNLPKTLILHYAYAYRYNKKEEFEADVGKIKDC